MQNQNNSNNPNSINEPDAHLKTMHYHAIEQQIRPWHVDHPQLIDLLRKHPRHLFLKGQTCDAYVDQNLNLNYAKLFEALGLKFDAPNSEMTQNQRAPYVLAPKLEARLLQIIIEHLELQIKALYENYQIWQAEHPKESINEKNNTEGLNHTLNIVMLGADTGYIPHILNALIQSEYYHEALEIDATFKINLKITIIEPDAHLLTLLSANLQEHHAAHLGSFKIMQNQMMQHIPINDDLQKTDLIFATGASPYLLPIYAQALTEGGYGVAFVGEKPLQNCEIYQQKEVQSNQNIQLTLVKEKTLFETWVPMFDVPAPKVFVF